MIHHAPHFSEAVGNNPANRRGATMPGACVPPHPYPLPREREQPPLPRTFMERFHAFLARICAMKHQTSGRRRRRKETLIHHKKVSLVTSHLRSEASAGRTATPAAIALATAATPTSQEVTQFMERDPEPRPRCSRRGDEADRGRCSYHSASLPRRLRPGSRLMGCRQGDLDWTLQITGQINDFLWFQGIK